MNIKLTGTGVASLKKRDLFAQDNILKAFKKTIVAKPMNPIIKSKKGYHATKVLGGKFSVFYLFNKDKEAAEILAISKEPRYPAESDEAVDKIIKDEGSL